MSDVLHVCHICALPAQYRCSACKAVQYCSQKCQRRDWAAHKLDCQQVVRKKRQEASLAIPSPSPPQAQTRFPMASVHALPDEVLIEVFRCLSPKELAQCARSCVRWRHITSLQSIWHTICLEQGVIPTSTHAIAGKLHSSGPAPAKAESTASQAAATEDSRLATSTCPSSFAAGSALSGIRALRQSRSWTRPAPAQLPPCREGSPDYKQLYVAAARQKARWESGTYTESILPGHMHNVESLQLVQSSALGEVLISSSWDHEVRVWSCSTHRCLRQLVGHVGWITCMVAGGGWVASGALDRTICVWQFEAPAAHEACRILQHPASVTSCCWLCQGRGIVAAGCCNGAMYIWNIKSGERVHTMESARDSVWAMRSLSWDSGVAGGTDFLLATSSRDCLGRVFCGTLAGDGSVTARGGNRASLLMQVLRGHSMALLCMDLTSLRVAEVWGAAAARAIGGADVAAAGSGTALVALGSADVELQETPWVNLAITKSNTSTQKRACVLAVPRTGEQWA
eukprot:jgi/Ulvmu1/4734/UM020_0018.1